VAAKLTGGEVSPAARAVAPALLVTALIYAFGDVSGAHINPAVTLAFVTRGLFAVRWLVPYWLAQLVGALAGTAAVALLLGDVAAGASTPHVGPWQALGIEIVLTGLLVTVTLGTADRARGVHEPGAVDRSGHGQRPNGRSLDLSGGADDRWSDGGRRRPRAPWLGTPGR
jgi:glycerol uptake facilitator-like aquaporin